jgi:hypothetical protein
MTNAAKSPPQILSVLASVEWDLPDVEIAGSPLSAVADFVNSVIPT